MQVSILLRGVDGSVSQAYVQRKLGNVTKGLAAATARDGSPPHVPGAAFPAPISPLRRFVHELSPV
jgi:hypothetical protein